MTEVPEDSTAQQGRVWSGHFDNGDVLGVGSKSEDRVQAKGDEGFKEITCDLPGTNSTPWQGQELDAKGELE